VVIQRQTYNIMFLYIFYLFYNKKNIHRTNTKTLIVIMIFTTGEKEKEGSVCAKVHLEIYDRELTEYTH
jgi:hypothetical protein